MNTDNKMFFRNRCKTIYYLLSGSFTVSKTEGFRMSRSYQGPNYEARDLTLTPETI